MLRGGKFPELLPYLVSATVRASLKTLKGCVGQHDSLMALATDSFPSAEHNYSSCMPRGWDHEAFCTALTKASHHTVTNTIGRIPKGRSLQSIIYKELCTSEELSQRAWFHSLHKRGTLSRDWTYHFLSILLLCIYNLFLLHVTAQLQSAPCFPKFTKNDHRFFATFHS